MVFKGDDCSVLLHARLALAPLCRAGMPCALMHIRIIYYSNTHNGTLYYNHDNNNKLYNNNNSIL